MDKTTIQMILLPIAGYLVGILVSRWKYFKATDLHLQDIEVDKAKGKIKIED